MITSRFKHNTINSYITSATDNQIKKNKSKPYSLLTPKILTTNPEILQILQFKIVFSFPKYKTTIQQSTFVQSYFLFPSHIFSQTKQREKNPWSKLQVKRDEQKKSLKKNANLSSIERRSSNAMWLKEKRRLAKNGISHFLSPRVSFFYEFTPSRSLSLFSGWRRKGWILTTQMRWFLFMLFFIYEFAPKKLPHLSEAQSFMCFLMVRMHLLCCFTAHCLYNLMVICTWQSYSYHTCVMSDNILQLIVQMPCGCYHNTILLWDLELLFFLGYY